MIYDSNSSVLGMVVSFWFLVPEKQEISVKWSNPLCELCPVNPNAKHESVLFFIVLIFKILCFLFFPFKKKCISQIEIWSNWNHWPKCPAHRFNTEETAGHCAYCFSVWWKIKCHRLLFRAQSPIHLHPIYFWESEGPLTLAGVLFCSCKTCVCWSGI